MWQNHPKRATARQRGQRRPWEKFSGWIVKKRPSKKPFTALNTLPVEQIVVAAKFADRSEEVFFYGNPKEIIQLLALAQFQIGFRYPLGVWDQEKDDGQE